jgi:CO dehydrogenase/acetyl-CoA synthase epsilon subunit
MNFKIVFFLGITYLVIGCNFSHKKKICDCDIIKIDVEKYFSNKNLTYSSEKIKFKISYFDTLNELKKINFTIGESQ